MPWNADQQKQYSDALNALIAEYSAAFTTWTNTIQDSARDPSLQQNTDKAAAQVGSVLQKMRAYMKDLQATSSASIAQDDMLQNINTLAMQIAEEKTTLAKLRGESRTRDEQAHSLNPKATPSPYTNLLALNRTFRDSTRFTILIMSIVFGVLTLGIGAYLIYTMLPGMRPSPTGPMGPMGPTGLAGGGRHRRSYK